MNCLEHFYVQFYQHKGVLTEEQNTGDFNLMYEALRDV
jgi:hypothetical protein